MTEGEHTTEKSEERSARAAHSMTEEENEAHKSTVIEFNPRSLRYICLTTHRYAMSAQRARRQQRTSRHQRCRQRQKIKCRGGGMFVHHLPYYCCSALLFESRCLLLIPHITKCFSFNTYETTSICPTRFIFCIFFLFSRTTCSVPCNQVLCCL